MKNNTLLKQSLKRTLSKNKLLVAGMALAILASAIAALLPPLVLERAVNLLTLEKAIPLLLALGYFLAILLSDVMESLQNTAITIFGQKITHGIRSTLCEKLSLLPADYFHTHKSGAIASIFTNDGDAIDVLYSDGVVSMLADCLKLVAILAVIFSRSIGLGLLIAVILPLLFFFTRWCRRRMNSAQLDNRRAIAKVNNHVPETLRCLRMIRTFHAEKFMEDSYDESIKESYDAVDRSNFIDSIYSPVILLTQAAVTAVMMVLAAKGAAFRAFFGLSVGSAVAMIAYISQIFSPLENIGMEIQNIQAAAAALQHINEFLGEEEWKPAVEMAGGEGNVEGAESIGIVEKNIAKESILEKAKDNATANTLHDKDLKSKLNAGDVATSDDVNASMDPLTASVETVYSTVMKNRTDAASFYHVTFGYEHGSPVLQDLSFSVKEGENVTFAGRTGAGKTTIFRLLIGLYQPDQGLVLLDGKDPCMLEPKQRRSLYGCVEQDFHIVAGTVGDQVTLYDPYPEEEIRKALAITGMEETIAHLPQGLDTTMDEKLFSKGQLQLLSISRAIISNPKILLLDEITANLDSETEAKVIRALQESAKGRTVISISHRLSESIGRTRVIEIG